MGDELDSTDGVLPESAPDGETTSYDIPMAQHLRAAVSQDWDPAPPMPHSARPDAAAPAARRRAALSERFPATLVAVPAGALTPRANDTDYPFRAASAFTWLTAETEADAVLVLFPRPDGGHREVLYLAQYAQPGEARYFTDRMHGAVWVGNVPSLADTATALGVETRPRSAPRLGQQVDELRLVKDDWELARLQEACDATVRGFTDVAREIATVLDRDVRGERWLEGTFWRRARLEGNDVGYTSILGSGRNATTLHWWRNHGRVQSGQLLLADMGVETDSLYTADVTRTLPVSGEWTAEQLRVYRAVQEAQAAGIAEVKAGADFYAAHRAAQWVLADHLHSWGVLPVPAAVSCADDPDQPGAGLHRRYTLHGTSHMLGIDVHDCALARNEMYREGTLEAGYVLTVEPGLYFQVNDRTVPDELRGIGVRIEDDVAVTESGSVNLSAALPRDPDEVTAWMREAQASRPEL